MTMPATSFADAFLRYIDVNTNGIKEIRQFYLPFFQPSRADCNSTARSNVL